MKGAHLWKRILNQGISLFPPFNDLDWLAGAIIKSPIIVVEVEAAGEMRPIDLSAYKGCSIPFPRFWMEQRSTAVNPDRSVAGVVYLGWFVEATQTEEGHDVTAHEVMTHPSDSRLPVGCRSRFKLNTRGDYVEGSVRFDILDAMTAAYSEDHIHTHVRGSIAGCLDVLMMLGCRNIATAAHDNDPKQVRRAVKRHGGTPDSYRYHTLVVRPAGAKSDAPAQAIGIMPRHVCRGHFAEYGPEFGKGLLFGKYAGRFYMPPCVKGRKENGVVEKDYAVAAAR